MTWLSHDRLQPKLNLPAFMTLLTEEDVWGLAHAIAYQGAGRVRTNPLVGSVLVDGSMRFVHAAAHQRYGDAHAEAILLREVLQAHGREFLRDKILYCTLEPCAHQGKTASCAQMIATLPLKGVVYAEVDPNPLVSGKGERIIRQAGIPCELRRLVDHPISRLGERASHFVTTGVPFVGLKAAVSLDGIMAFHQSRRAWFSSDVALGYAHWLRLLYDGIIVGADTLILDNPRLTARHGVPFLKTPLRIVMDPSLRAARAGAQGHLPHLIAEDPTNTLWVIRQDLEGKDADRRWLENQGVEVLCLPSTNSHEPLDGGMDIAHLLKNLGQRGLSSVLLEGGRGVWGSFMAARQVQRLHLIMNMAIFGSGGSNHWTDALSLPAADPLSLTDVSYTPLGHNLLVEGTIDKVSEQAESEGA